MATHNITINEQGAPTPKDMGQIEPYDIVSFGVGNNAIILCLDPGIFGAARIEIPAGDTVAVRVKPNAPHGSFEYLSCGSQAAWELNCSEIRAQNKGDMGGGSVGGGGEE